MFTYDRERGGAKYDEPYQLGLEVVRAIVYLLTEVRAALIFYLYRSASVHTF